MEKNLVVTTAPPSLYSWARFGGYECSSKGDTRFSAFFARLPEGRTIEEIYQCDTKFYDPGGTNWKLGKGKPPKDLTIDLYKEYLNLWRIWAENNGDLMDELAELCFLEHEGVLSDRYATGPVNQARALSDLLNERLAKAQAHIPAVHNRYKATAPKDAVYIGRPSKWGNPFKVEKPEDRGVMVEKFREWIKTQPELIAAVKKELRGKDLVCYCKPKSCHGDVLLEIANERTE